jgi:hypothetical protein
MSASEKKMRSKIRALGQTTEQSLSTQYVDVMFFIFEL